MKDVISRAAAAAALYAVAFAFAPAVNAEDESAQAQVGRTEAAAKSAYSNKPICKRVAVTGSYVKKTVCKTQEQMDREKAAMDQWAQEIKRNGSWNTVNSDH